MTRRRWIADEVAGNHAALTGAHADHLIRVLRARVGQEFDVVANGTLRRGQIFQIGDHRVEFELGPEILAATTLSLTLLLAIVKFDRMEWAIEKCTELGVSKFVPVIARRTDAHLASAAIKRAERWRRITAQASEQSRRSAVPEIASPMKLNDAVVIAAGLRVVLSEAEEKTRLPDLLAAQVVEAALAIGPEGGWTEDELKLFQQSGWIPASLGPTILRAETAAIAAAAIIISHI
jgi:16S rRNA (uracil1498-N3)-methyltransferase